MIEIKSITLEWIEQVSKSNRNADKILVEKVIRALLLLEGLVKQSIPFIFKGGTALMLHLDSSKRLSIDIDIVMSDKPENLETLLEKSALEQGFLRVEHQKRNINSKLVKAHYKFYYAPLHRTIPGEEYVLLDILFEEIQYKNLVNLKIESIFLPPSNSPLFVKVPSIDDLMGDKLTAYAPNTTGIPYFKGTDSMSMEIVKQLYDIGSLFEYVSDIETVKNTFSRFAIAELSYREMDNLTENDVLDDIYQTSLCIVLRGKEGRGNYDQLQKGIQRISRFIFSENFHIERAILYASKAAYLASAIKNNSKTIEKFTKTEEMNNWFIDAPLSTKLNKLKKTNPEAFFYWFKIFELEKHLPL